MRILHTADWHLGKKLDFYSRLDEQKAVMAEIIQIAEEKAVDMVIIAGDLFDTFNPPNEATELLYKTLKKLAKNGKVPVIAIAGNHDSPDRINVADVISGNRDRKSTRLNSSHVAISYAVFCLK